MSIELKLWEQQVLQSELETIKVPHARVFKQQPGSNIFFQTSKTVALADCKQKQSLLQKDLEFVTKQK